MARKSLRNIHYAKLNKDSETELSYETPKRIPGAISAKVTPAANTETQYADDGRWDMATTLGETAIEFEAAELPLEIRADITGASYKNGVMEISQSDVPPDLAFGYMSEVKPGVYELAWHYKGQFQPVEDEYSTRTDSPEFTSKTLKGTFGPRLRDGKISKIANSGDEGFTEQVDTWFDKVPVPAQSPTA